MNEGIDRRSVREILASITNDLFLLGSQLFGIASAEGRVAAGAAGSGAAVAALGVVLLLFGALVLVGALLLVMTALGLSPWAAALAVGVLLTFGGAVALHVGVEMVRHVPFHFSETRGAIAAGVSWLKSLQR